MEETRTIKVLPGQVNSKTELWQNFGWSLMSSQEINNSESHLERKIDGVYNVTTKEHYVNLLFKRDTSMENYDELVELEKEYYSIPDNVYPEKPSIKILGISLLGIISVVFAFVYFLGSISVMIPMILIGLGLVPLGIFLFRKTKRDYNKVMEQNDKNDANKARIRKEARSLLQ